MEKTNILDNAYIDAVLVILTTIYLSTGMIKLPTTIRNLFKNNIFRLVFLSLLLVYRFDNAPHIAFMVALIFVATMYYIGQVEMLENLSYLEHFCEKNHTPTAEHFCERANNDQH